MIKKISVIGSGGWGCALAQLLSEKGYEVLLWSWTKEESDTIKADRENKTCLKGIKLKDSIKYTYSLKDASEADLYVIAVPSHAVLGTMKAFSEFAKKDVIIVNVAKGFEKNGLKRLSTVIEENCKFNPVVVLSGPTHAEEVAMGIPSTIVATSVDMSAAEIVQDVFMNDNLRVYTHGDVLGVELGGALKNIIALCAGISDGLGLGDNTKAALMTRGLAEISRLGIAMGALAHTFAGLTGVGDLIVTCTSEHSRNRRAGILIGKGMSAVDAQKEVKMVVEGIKAAESAYLLSKKYNVEMPITEVAYKIIFENLEPHEAVLSLMNRDKKSEADFTAATWL